MSADRTVLAAEMPNPPTRELGAEHVASVYAEALLGAAEKAGPIAALLDEFDALVAEVLERFPKFEELLASGVISHEEKVGILDRVLAGRISALLLNFLKVLSRRGRLDCLRAIHRQVHELARKRAGQVSVYVTSAVPLDAGVAERLRTTLRPLVDGEPILHTAVDPNLLGGIVVRVGDRIYDASVARQLENLRQQMIHRSAHEIQSRRNRFRYPAGN